MPTKAEQKKAEAAAEVPPEPEASVESIEAQASKLFDAAPEGVVKHHLGSILKAVGALHDAEDTAARMVRPEGE